MDDKLTETNDLDILSFFKGFLYDFKEGLKNVAGFDFHQVKFHGDYFDNVCFCHRGDFLA